MSTTAKLPREVTLCGCGYTVTEREGSIIFTEAYPVWSQQTILRFQREINEGGWYLTLHGDTSKAYVPHIVQAHRMIAEAYGDGGEG